MKRLIALFAVALLCLGIFCACGEGDTDVTPPSAVCQHRDANDDSLCDKCSESYTDGVDVTSPAHTHTWGDWSVTTPATCQAKGEETRFCACGEDETRDVAIDLNAHTYDAENTCTGCLDYKDKGVMFALQTDNTYAVTDYTGNTTEVIIPSTYKGVAVTTIGSYSFENCSDLKSITIPDTTTLIISSAFNGCGNLEHIIVKSENPKYYNAGNCLIEAKTKTLIRGCKNSVIPTDGTVTSIGSDAFSGCSGLASITIPSSVVSIGANAFSGCTGIESITVENENPTYHSTGNCLIETASKTLISGCKNSVIPTDGSVTSIGDYAFYGCSGLTSITIPSSITSIGYFAFSGCSGLESITVASGNTKYHSASNCLIETASKRLILGCKNSIIPSDGSVTYIYRSAFENCNDLISITIPASITQISPSAFNNCPNLENITVESGNTKYHSAGNCLIETESKKLVLGCKSSIILNDGSVTCIGTYAFKGCSSLTSITIPSNITSFEDYAFEGCNTLTAIHITNLESWCKINFTSAASNPLCYGKNLYLNGNLITSLEIPSSITNIGSYAFSGCSGLTSITIPSSVTSIGNRAFYGCTSLTSITIPSSVTSIGNGAFYGCTSLTSITIPSSIASIGSSAFRGCTNLTTIKYRATLAQWNAISKDWAWDSDTGSYTITYNYTGE